MTFATSSISPSRHSLVYSWDGAHVSSLPMVLYNYIVTSAYFVFIVSCFFLSCFSIIFGSFLSGAAIQLIKFTLFSISRSLCCDQISVLFSCSLPFSVCNYSGFSSSFSITVLQCTWTIGAYSSLLQQL